MKKKGHDLSTQCLEVLGENIVLKSQLGLFGSLMLNPGSWAP